MIFFALCLTATALMVVTLRDRHLWQKKQFVTRLAVSVGLVAGGFLSLDNVYVLGKLIGRLAMPTGLLWLGMLGAIFFGIYKKNGRLLATSSIFFVVYTLIGNILLGGLLVAVLESDYDIAVFEQDPFDAVLVLGGGASGDAEFAQVNDAGDRVVVGARLYHARLTPLLITSGSSIPGLGHFTDVSVATRTIWTGLGIPNEAILQLPDPKNTREEIAALKILKEQEGWERVGLVTSAWHMRRAMKLARKEGLDVHPLPADFRTRIVWDGILSIVPDAHGFALVQRACWEFLGAAVGR